MNSIIAITYAFMLGVCPLQAMGFGTNYEEFVDPTHASFEIGVDLYDCVKLYAGEETYQIKDGSLFNWLPYTQSYWVGASFHKEVSDSMKLSVGITHKCQHPVDAWGIQLSDYNYACTEIYVGIDGKFEVF